MPSADRYFLCLPKLVRQLKSSAPARARISRLYYAFSTRLLCPTKAERTTKGTNGITKRHKKQILCFFGFLLCLLSPLPDLGKAPLPKYLHLPVPVRGWLGSGPNSGGGRRCFVARS